MAFSIIKMLLAAAPVGSFPAGLAFDLKHKSVVLQDESRIDFHGLLFAKSSMIRTNPATGSKTDCVIACQLGSDRCNRSLNNWSVRHSML